MKGKTGRKLAFVIPIYNEAENLRSLIARLDDIAASLSCLYELKIDYVFVDDGSTDDSADLLFRHSFPQRKVLIRQLSRNFGKEAALSAGIDAAASYDAAVIMDADLQHPPEMVMEFVRLWYETDADSIFAYKADRQKFEGFLKARLANMFYWVINRNARFTIQPDAGDFRLINQSIMMALQRLPESERFMKGLYGWVGFRQIGVPFTPASRAGGRSSFTASGLLLMTLDAMTSFSVAPLRMMTMAGLSIAALSAFYGAYIVIERIFFGGVEAGIASVLVLISFFGGFHLAFLGFLGEYVGKAVMESKRRPNFIVARDLQRGEEG